ncbi:MAG: tRNA pseudouridine(38-40) synthase TruA [Verrucomicrobiia bacterium]
MEPSTLKIKLVIAYDGTNYAGWQVQKTGVGVQQVIEDALAKLFPGRPKLHSSSRTDTGVHALGMAAHLELEPEAARIPLRKLPLAINAHLPEAIRVMAASHCASDFHARFSATGKQYRYFVWNHAAQNPLLRHQAWLVHKPLDVSAMRAGARHLVGRHDFASFAATHDYEIRSTVRTVRRCDIRRGGPLLTFVIEADGFLYRMCRGIVGTLVQVGIGKIQPDALPSMLALKDRRAGGMSAPADGLVLWKVFYAGKKKGASGEVCL